MTISITRHPVALFFSQFTSPLIYILIAAATLSFLLSHYLDAWVILGVLVVNALLGFFQEQRAEQSLAALQQLLAPNARVVRVGKTFTLPARLLVLGDIVELSEGDRVPADIRVIETHALATDESLLTGESIPVEKQVAPITQSASVAQRTNLVYSGTIVTRGRGRGVVVATGSNTALGALAQTTRDTLSEETTLARNVTTLSKQILAVVLVGCGLIFVIGVAEQRDVLTLLLTAVATAVSAVPEGLPAVMTIALAIGVQRMTKHRAIIRHLAAIETLGAVTLIASDKTGTITENELSVSQFISAGRLVAEFSGSGYEPVGRVRIDGKKPSKNAEEFLKRIFTVASLANDARLIQESRDWRIIGDPTEGALIVAAYRLGLQPDELRLSFPRTSEVPFQSEHRLMAVSYRGHHLRMATKGSIQAIVDRSTHFRLPNGETIRMTAQRKKEILKSAHERASQGYRILALAEGKLPLKTTTLTKQRVHSLTYLGFVTMLDAPRHSAIAAIQRARRGGIAVAMITGDTAATATAIGKQLGLLKTDEQAVSGRQLSLGTLNQFEKIVRTHKVFAEISPQLKLRIIEQFQADGAIVAVTGDGANDAPILKRAQVGIAMGQGGTDVARGAADIILADNNFVTILHAIEEGRTIFTNIRRVLWYLLATNSSELFIILGSLVLHLPLPLLPTQLLWINVVTEGTGTIGLATEPRHNNVLTAPPRSPNEPFLNSMIIQRIWLVGSAITGIVLVLFWHAFATSGSVAYARSVAFASMAILQVINLFSARSLTQSITQQPVRTNPLLVVSAIASFLVAIATLTVPFLRSIFHTVPISGQDWTLILVSTAAIVGIVELHKLAWRGKTKKTGRIPALIC